MTRMCPESASVRLRHGDLDLDLDRALALFFAAVAAGAPAAPSTGPVNQSAVSWW